MGATCLLFPYHQVNANSNFLLGDTAELQASRADIILSFSC